jgi:hypothetical protein
MKGGEGMPAESLAEFELFVMLAVYATLARLGEKGLLTFRHSAPQPVQGGRARKFCLLTPEGLEALEVATERIARMTDGLDLGSVPVEGA